MLISAGTNHVTGTTDQTERFDCAWNENKLSEIKNSRGGRDGEGDERHSCLFPSPQTKIANRQSSLVNRNKQQHDISFTIS